VLPRLRRPGAGGEALRHARRCLAIGEEHGIGGWRLAFGYEALARAASLAGNPPLWFRSLARAEELLATLSGEERDLLAADLATIPVPE